MKKRVSEYWDNLAMAEELDEEDALRKVLDPNDKRGVKNAYCDAYLKYYLKKYLVPSQEDVLLEIGSGTGRLTEYLSDSVRQVYGVDIAKAFIDRCNMYSKKKGNTIYYQLSEIERLNTSLINKMYSVWALMYIEDDSELIAVLQRYRALLPDLREAVFLEQVKRTIQPESRAGQVDCVYRSLSVYQEIFRASGFRVKEYIVMGERYHAPFYRLLHLFGNLLPRRLRAISDRLFSLDRKIMGNNTKRVELINDKRATDILFCLEAV